MLCQVLNERLILTVLSFVACSVRLRLCVGHDKVLWRIQAVSWHAELYHTCADVTSSANSVQSVVVITFRIEWTQ